METNMNEATDTEQTKLMPAAPCSAPGFFIDPDGGSRSSLQIASLTQQSLGKRNVAQSFPQYWESLQASRKPQRTEVAPSHKELEGFQTVCYRSSKTPVLSEDLPDGYRILRCLPVLDIQGDVLGYEYCLASWGELQVKPNVSSSGTAEKSTQATTTDPIG